MAQVYGLPESYPEPPELRDFFKSGGGLDMDGLLKAEDKWAEGLAQWCKDNTNSRSDLVGKIIRIQYADGYAQYMIWKTSPLSILHLPLGDGWDLPDYQTRGLRVSDVKDMVERDRMLAELFSKKTT